MDYWDAQDWIKANPRPTDITPLAWWEQHRSVAAAIVKSLNRTAAGRILGLRPDEVSAFRRSHHVTDSRISIRHPNPPTRAFE